MVSAVIAAAGSSSRMGYDKLRAELDGIPVVVHSLLAFEKAPSVAEIVVVGREEDIPLYLGWKEEYRIRKLSTAVPGGETRQQSVFVGVRACSPDSAYYAIHDGARPFVTVDEIETVIADAGKYGAASLGVPVKDTIKVVDGNGMIERTPDRTFLYATQTPQVFSREIYLAGMEAALKDGIDLTDDCQLVERVGGRVYMTVGSYRNLKLTTEEDLLAAAAFVREGRL